MSEEHTGKSLKRVIEDARTDVREEMEDLSDPMNEDKQHRDREALRNRYLSSHEEKLNNAGEEDLDEAQSIISKINNDRLNDYNSIVIPKTVIELIVSENQAEEARDSFEDLELGGLLGEEDC